MYKFNKQLWQKKGFSGGERLFSIDEGHNEIPQDLNIEENIPLWPCPQCWKRNLTLKKTIDEELSPGCEKGDITGEDGTYLFSAYLECKECGDLFVISGPLHYKMHIYSEKNGAQTCCYEKIYEVQFIYPNLRLFYLEDYYPKEIKDILDNSFKVFFSDINSSITWLRILIERLLDLNEFGNIPRKTNSHYNTLDKRINDACQEGKITEDIKSFLTAIKWIGNEGAHFSSKNNKDSYLNALELVEYVLETVYSNKGTCLKERADAINKDKGTSSN